MNSPKVTILMAVYNCEIYVCDAIESMLGQTFKDFEVLIINDSSKDRSLDILAAYDDPRIKIIHNDTNIGLTRSLNRGLAAAKGDFIARMDCDDISMAHRLEKQVAFLEQHPDIGILGSSCLLFKGSQKEENILHMPESDLNIRWKSLLANPFLHSTVIIRQSVLKQNSLGYDEAIATAQDYDLWTRILRHTHGANLREPLIRLRKHHDAITSTQRKAQLKNHDIIALRTIRDNLREMDVTPEEVSQLRALFVGGKEVMLGLNTADLDTRQVSLSALYLDLFDAFLRRHSQAPGLANFRRQEVIKVARIALFPPFRRGWIHLFFRLVSMEPRFLIYYYACRMLQLILRGPRSRNWT